MLPNYQSLDSRINLYLNMNNFPVNVPLPFTAIILLSSTQITLQFQLIHLKQEK